MPFPREIDEARVMRGQQIAKLDSQIKRLDDSTYQVNSQSGHGLYTVVKGTRDWRCSCPDHMYREVKCKHIWAVEFSQAIRQKIVERVVIKPLDIHACTQCMSQSIVKHGLRTTKNGAIQRYFCKNCGKWFVINLGFERMKATPHAISSRCNSTSQENH